MDRDLLINWAINLAKEISGIDERTIRTNTLEILATWKVFMDEYKDVTKAKNKTEMKLYGKELCSIC